MDPVVVAGGRQRGHGGRDAPAADVVLSLYVAGTEVVVGVGVGVATGCS
ncbi:hypothetical protein GCM10028771_26640 [Nocardioides marmoraquaticus]